MQDGNNAESSSGSFQHALSSYLPSQNSKLACVYLEKKERKLSINVGRLLAKLYFIPKCNILRHRSLHIA